MLREMNILLVLGEMNIFAVTTARPPYVFVV